jgi:hypothetical protein
MLSLRDMQTEFVQAILQQKDSNHLIVSDSILPQHRLDIYRNNYRIGLKEALQATFPVTARLVGDNFFRAMAKEFTRAHPPSVPCLAEYGDNFPAFIADFEPAQSVPYLSDVALFEWLMNEAAHQPAYEGNAFYSVYPVGRIWESNQEDYQGSDIVSLDEGGGWFVVEKRDGIVQWRYLNSPEDAFDNQGSNDNG